MGLPIDQMQMLPSKKYCENLEEWSNNLAQQKRQQNEHQITRSLPPKQRPQQDLKLYQYKKDNFNETLKKGFSL